ncbi:MAG: ribosomal protein S18-alanine N-acetyltransferase [Clostridia bacterium]|nr:ribosomal protein S18-alanine N-acetyltransferase [Clostridia bacterium]
MNIQIAEMTLYDLNSIKSILNTDFDDFWNYNIFKTELENPNSRYIVAKINDTIVGFAGFIILYDEADISNIVVNKNYRHMGIGSSMLKRLIDLAKILDINFLNLEVNSSNVFAINLYKNFSFIQCGLRKKYYNNSEDAILMRLTLK